MDISKCVELYKLMAERWAASGCADNQARVYDEMVEFIGNCDSVEDSIAKIKNSKYYLAPTIALVKDKLFAWKNAAIKNNMPEIVEVVDQKLAKIDADSSEAYVAGHEQTIQNIKSKYILTMQAFALIFDAYVGYIANGEEHNLTEINNHLAVLKKPHSDFYQLSTEQVFRDLIPVNDEGYDHFVKDIENFIATGKLEFECVVKVSQSVEDSEYDKAWEEAKSYKSEIINAGRNSQNPSLYRHNLQEMVAVAPKVNIDVPVNLEGLSYSYREIRAEDRVYASSKKIPAASGDHTSAAGRDATNTLMQSEIGKIGGFLNRLKGGA